MREKLLEGENSEESLEDVKKLEVVEENKPLLEEEMKWNGRVLDVAIVILGLGGALDWFSVSLDAVHCCGGGRWVMLSVGGGGRNGVLTVDLVYVVTDGGGVIFVVCRR
ncbi:hypothetical protein IFM89_030106 [Coptis chinensis]|uniref:Uncharacterized protein n=1 Tax=Coptis chinensis TaxID=261450 RepID=A0A835M008_9MAGN|nr:hypothetical protein IFM89_030106 [Coptis chinensis]